MTPSGATQFMPPPSTGPTHLFGVDGAKGQWAVCELSWGPVAEPLSSFPPVACAMTLRRQSYPALEERLRRLAQEGARIRVVVDAPVGLLPGPASASGMRACDRLARAFIQREATDVSPMSIFPPPTQALFEDMLGWESFRPGHPVSAQTFHIRHVMAAARKLKQHFPDAVLEGHPEVTWLQLRRRLMRAGVTLPNALQRTLHKKNTDEGFEERLWMLHHAMPGLFADLEQQLLMLHAQKGHPARLRKSGRDDWLDACSLTLVALAWETLQDNLPVLADPSAATLSGLRWPLAEGRVIATLEASELEPRSTHQRPENS